MSNLVIGVASTAPAYSLAATLGFIVAIQGVGVHAPAVLLVSFVPILFVSLGYRYLNKADPDAGTTFAWTTRAFGPWIGWINGWAIFVADVIVMASLAVIAAQYTFLLFNWNYGVQLDGVWLIVGAVDLDRADDLDLLPGHRALGRDPGLPAQRRDRRSSRCSRSWRSSRSTPDSAAAARSTPSCVVVQPVRPVASARSSPACCSASSSTGAGTRVSPSTRSRATRRRARARPPSSRRFCSLLIYLVVAASAQAFARHEVPRRRTRTTCSSALGQGVFGSPWYKLLIIAVLTSASASTQTTILPTARTTLSMAQWGRSRTRSGKIHPRYLTPTVSTLGMGALSVVWTAFLLAGRLERERPQRLDHGARLRDLLLLRLHRPRLRLVLPARALQERARLRPRRAGAGGRRRDDGLHLRQGVRSSTAIRTTTTRRRSSASRCRS